MKNNTNKEAYLERLRNLADVNKTSIKESQNRTLGTLIDYTRAADGVAYGIIKENHNYYVKKGGMKADPNVSDFAYIGGLANITTYQYKSFGDADKNRNMILHTINEAVSLKPSLTGSKKRLNEDVAGQEIDNAESMLGDLDAATSAEETSPEGEAEMAAGLDAEPMGGEMPAGEPAPAPEGGEMPAGEPAPEGGEMPAEPAPEGGEMPAEPAPEGEMGDEPAPEGEMGDEPAPEGEMGEVAEPIRELEKGIGKITNAIRKTDLEPAMVKSFLKSFIQSFKDKLPDLEIEDRKEIANGILKIVPPEDVADLSSSMPADEVDEEKQGCSECGTFAQYAESMGYDSAESLMECGEEGVANLVSNYANHAADGQNDGDADGVALVIKIINPEILNTLKNDYGHEDYANKLEPMVNSMQESTDEENIAQLNELFAGLRGAFGSVGKGIGNAASQVGKGISGAATQVGQAIGKQVDKAGQAIDKGVTNVKQAYHGAEVSGEVKKLESLANDLGAQVAALNARLVKAGQPEVNAQKIIAAISNQIRAGKGASVAGTAAGAQFQKEGLDPAYTETQPITEEDDDIEGLGGEESTEEKPEVGFTGAQSLGAAVAKPDGAPTTISVTSENGTTVDVSLNEVMKKLKKVVADSKPSKGKKGIKEGMDEISMGLANKAANIAYDKAFNLQDTDPLGARKANQQGNMFANNLNPQMEQELKSIGVEGFRRGETVILNLPNSQGGSIGLQLKVFPTSYKITSGTPQDVDQSLLRRVMNIIKKIQADLNSQIKPEPAPNELEEMNESERKIRAYVRKRLEENAGLRKPSLNEDKKSSAMKKLDEIIDKQFGLYESVVKKKLTKKA